ncbi:TRAP transporter small permease [Elioraea rosea]|uniref:TRAP transporter small permease n=1 Tax=Elioraea rosea TaxID=2492390 RepID=UPI001181F111|nr:TRAP transporter small permease subunit [Elioraea rosea]
MKAILLGGAAAIDRAVALLCRVIVAATGLVLLAVLAANVIARYALGMGGFAWAQEIPEQIFPWFIAAGVVLAAQAGAHIAVDILPRQLPERGRQVLIVIVNAMVVAAYAWLALLALEVAEIARLQQSTILRIPGSYGYWAMSMLAGLTAVSAATIALRVTLLGPGAAPEAAREDSVT